MQSKYKQERSNPAKEKLIIITFLTMQKTKFKSILSKKSKFNGSMI